MCCAGLKGRWQVEWHTQAATLKSTAGIVVESVTGLACCMHVLYTLQLHCIWHIQAKRLTFPSPIPKGMGCSVKLNPIYKDAYTKVAAPKLEHLVYERPLLLFVQAEMGMMWRRLQQQQRPPRLAAALGALTVRVSGHQPTQDILTSWALHITRTPCQPSFALLCLCQEHKRSMSRPFARESGW